MLCSAQSSVFSTGAWYKFAIEKDGIYKISYDQLKTAGVSPGSIDPRNIRIYSMAGGMLPQANFISSDGLQEIPLEIQGEADGKFNSNDFILFYAEGPDRYSFLPDKQVFSYESNLYSTQNYCYLTISDSPGKRITTAASTVGGAPVSSFNDFIYHERDESNVLSSGREWYGEYFFLTTEYTFDFSISGIVDNTEIALITDIVSQSFNATSMMMVVNGTTVGEPALPSITNSTYAQKGRHKRDTLKFNSSFVSAASRSSQTVRMSLQKAATGTSKAYLDGFQLAFIRKLSVYNKQTRFRSAESVNNASTRYTIADVASSTEVWDISDVFAPVKQPLTRTGDNAEFTSENNQTLKEFIAFSGTHSPTFVGKVENQNLMGTTTPEFIIITARSLLVEAERLAAHRRERGISTFVVTIDKIYNEFSSGRQDVTAIRNFVRHLRNQNPSVLNAVLLFGKSSYDYKNRLANNTNMVPTYESRNSLSPLETYSSDDYYGFLENSEGEWRENPLVQSHTLDIGVGRLPVKTVTEAHNVVDKIIAYETSDKMLGTWRKNFVFIADDGSNSDGFTSIHQGQANAMAENIEELSPYFNTSKIFLGTYKKTVTPTGEIIPRASEDIQEAFKNALVINYTGHGSEKVLADEDVVTRDVILNLRNKTYPFLVTATCEFGRHDDPEVISTAEECVLLPNAGAIGMVTTARPVNSSTNFSLNQAFYDALFAKDGGEYQTLGQVFRQTKNESMSGVSNRNFSLLADPMLRLALPTLQIEVISIKTDDGSDTLKALSHVTVKGEIRESDGTLANGFNGIVESTLFDKRTRFITIGKNDPAFEFEEWHNPLFRGKATVEGGLFQFEFVLPKNIAYEINPGKLSLYADDLVTGRDAKGASGAFKIGGSEPNPTPDAQGPLVDAFMGDSTFTNGGKVLPNTTLVVRLFDEGGINISNYGIGNTLVAILDDNQEIYLLNEHFISDTNTYGSGWVNYPIYDLPPGKHTLTIKAWDTSNNPGEGRVDFVVSDKGLLEIDSFWAFPNPSNSATTFFFRHNRSGDDLQAEVTILSASGLEVQKLRLLSASSPHEIQIPVEEAETLLGKKLPSGVYFARLSVRSITDGSKSERVTKLIIVN
jgi:hypothetical protein